MFRFGRQRIEPIRPDEMREQPSASVTSRHCRIVPLAPEDYAAQSRELRADNMERGAALERWQRWGTSRFNAKGNE